MKQHKRKRGYKLMRHHVEGIGATPFLISLFGEPPIIWLGASRKQKRVRIKMRRRQEAGGFLCRPEVAR